MSATDYGPEWLAVELVFQLRCEGIGVRGLTQLWGRRTGRVSILLVSYSADGKDGLGWG